MTTFSRVNDNLEAIEQALLSQILCKDGQAIALGEIVEFIDGDRGKNYPTFDEFTPSGYCLFLNASNVTSTGFNFDSCAFITKEKDLVLRKGHLSPFDIVFTSRGTLGNVALYDNNIPFENIRINSGMLILRSKATLFNQFVLYALLKSSAMKVSIEQFKSGSAQPQLPIKDLENITFVFKDDKELILQISEKIRKIESIISINKAEIHKLKGISRLLLQNLSH